MLTHPTILRMACLGTLVLGSSCTQPIMNCTSSQGEYAAEYTLTDGDPSSVCGQLHGDVLGMQTFFQMGGKNGTPNYQRANVAIRAQAMGMMISYAEMHGVAPDDELFYGANAIGKFTDGFPDGDTFCKAHDFSDAHVTLPALDATPDDPATPDVDESHPAQPAIDASYRWSNARFVVSAESQGSQFEADLEYVQDGCTAKYHVVGVSPAVTCQTNEECNAENNGINSDFPVRCNTEIGLCVLQGKLPAYK